MKPVMPRPYSDDLRWRAMWTKEFLRYRVFGIVVCTFTLFSDNLSRNSCITFVIIVQCMK